jgi:electron transfer flavoprotein beta subunit
MKEIIDTECRIRLDSNHNIDEEDIKYIFNPSDEHALEEALRIKETVGGEVIIYAIARQASTPSFKYLLAKGADRVFIIPSNESNPVLMSQMIGNAVYNESGDFDLILAGVMGIDRNNGQIPGRLSIILDIPLVTMVEKIDLVKDRMICYREAETQLEMIEVRLPAVITVQRGINKLRYPTANSLIKNNESKIIYLSNQLSITHEKANIKYAYPKTRPPVKLFDGQEPDNAVRELIKALIQDKIL